MISQTWSEVVVDGLPCFRCDLRVDAFHPFQHDEKVVQEKRRLQDVLLLLTLDRRVVAGELSKLGNQADEKLRQLVLVVEARERSCESRASISEELMEYMVSRRAVPDPLPALPQKVREGAEQPARLLPCIVVEGDVGVLDDPLAVLLQDAVRKALLLLGVRLDGLRATRFSSLSMSSSMALISASRKEEISTPARSARM